MIDRFTVPLLTPLETAEHLQIPERTMYRWLSQQAAGHPLVHSIKPKRHGYPSVPFMALVEAYVLRSLRQLGLSTEKIREAAGEIRRQFRMEYGLASRRIATDGVDVFIHYLDTDELARAGGQPHRTRRRCRSPGCTARTINPASRRGWHPLNLASRFRACRAKLCLSQRPRPCPTRG